MTTKNKNKCWEFPFLQRTETYYRAIVNLLSFFNKNTENIHTRDLLFYVQTFQIKTDYNNYTDQIIKTDILKILIPEKKTISTGSN